MIAYVCMALLAALALLLLLRPWWQSGRAGEVRRRAANVAAYRSRLAEIDAEVAAGAMDAAAGEQHKGELAARLLADTSAQEATTAAAPRRLWLPGAIVVALPVFAAAAYWMQGSWRTQALVQTARTDPQVAQDLAVESMVQGLARRLEQQPEDAEGWAMLGRSYGVLERYTDAANAYGRANALTQPPNADTLVGEGEALAMARDRDLLGRPQQLFDAALAITPEHPKALWYAGLASAQARDYPATLRHWQKLRQQELPPELQQTLDTRLQELAAMSGEPVPSAAPAKPAPASGGVQLNVQVSLAPALKDKAVEGLALFVFAKADGGPPMPLAVRRLERAALPAEVMLDDSLAMMPQLKLSGFDRWVVTARLSKAGTAQAQSGDLEGSLTLGRADARAPVKLVIDRIVP